MSLATAQYNLRMLLKPFGVDVMPCSLKFGFRPTSKCRYPGVYPEIVDLILREIKKFANVTIWYSSEIDSWTNMEQEIQQGNIDFPIVCYSRTPQREIQFKFNDVPLQNLNYFALAADARRGSVTSLFGGFQKFISVFQPCLWLAILLLWTTVYVYRRYRPRLSNPFTLHRKLIWIFVALLSLHSLDLYANGILTRLVMPVERQLFEDTATLAEVVKSGKAKWVSFRAAAQEAQFSMAAERAKLNNTGDLSPLTQMALALEKNPTHDILPYTNLNYPAEKLQKRIDDNFVFVAPYDMVVNLAQKVCNSRIVELDGLSYFQCWFMYSNHTPDWVIKKIDAALLRRIDWLHPLTIRYRRMNERNAIMKPCDRKIKDPVVFTMTDFLGATVILFVGIGLATILLAWEWVTITLKRWKIHRSRAKQIDNKIESDQKTEHVEMSVMGRSQLAQEDDETEETLEQVKDDVLNQVNITDATKMDSRRQEKMKDIEKLDRTDKATQTEPQHPVVDCYVEWNMP